jgi:hypothetical protein
MKVLLDENIDIRFRFAFDNSGHEVITTEYMSWKGIKNGELLRLMSQHNFDVLIAVDKSLPYQHNQARLPVTIFILDVKKNVLPSLQAFMPDLLSWLSQPLDKKVIILAEPISLQ